LRKVATVKQQIFPHDHDNCNTDPTAQNSCCQRAAAVAEQWWQVQRWEERKLVNNESLEDFRGEIA